jgi:hypothetical protein
MKLCLPSEFFVYILKRQYRPTAVQKAPNEQGYFDELQNFLYSIIGSFGDTDNNPACIGQRRTSDLIKPIGSDFIIIGYGNSTAVNLL